MVNAKSHFVAILLALSLAACGSGPTKQSTGEYFDDAVITTKVKAAFVRDQDVKATDISVETYKGVVQLSGFAGTREEVEQAEKIASQVSGVRKVRNDISLKPKEQ